MFWKELIKDILCFVFTMMLPVVGLFYLVAFGIIQ